VRQERHDRTNRETLTCAQPAHVFLIFVHPRLQLFRGEQARLRQRPGFTQAPGKKEQQLLLLILRELRSGGFDLLECAHARTLTPGCDRGALACGTGNVRRHYP
jgi:hypothetical protein